MDIYKVWNALDSIKTHNLNDKEIIKLVRELLYAIYCKQGNSEDFNQIHLYFLIRDCLDIYGQMIDNRKFDKKYLKDTLKF